MFYWWRPQPQSLHMPCSCPYIGSARWDHTELVVAQSDILGHRDSRVTWIPRSMYVVSPEIRLIALRFQGRHLNF